MRRWLRKWLGVEELERGFGRQVEVLSKRVGECERELDVEDGSKLTEATATSARKRAMWLADLSERPLSEVERRDWEAGV